MYFKGQATRVWGVVSRVVREGREGVIRAAGGSKGSQGEDAAVGGGKETSSNGQVSSSEEEEQEQEGEQGGRGRQEVGVTASPRRRTDQGT